jgi:hypothetical protein
MRRYNLRLTLKDLHSRLALYTPEALWDVQRALDKIERSRGILYEASEEDRKAVHKEHLIAMYHTTSRAD